MQRNETEPVQRRVYTIVLHLIISIYEALSYKELEVLKLYYLILNSVKLFFKDSTNVDKTHVK